MRAFIDWLHHLFNPHCEHCEADREDRWRKEHECGNCESLLLIIEKQRNDYQLLIERLMKPPEQVENRPEHEFKPIMPRRVPWHIKQQQLEMADRIKAQQMEKEKKAIEELEIATGVKPNASS